MLGGLLCWGGSDSEASAMRETWVQSLGREDPLEEEMATHSSTVTWKIPWMEEPGGLQSVGSTKSQTRLSNFTPCVGYIEYEIVFQKSHEREVTQRKIFMKGPQKQRRGHGSAVKEHVRPTCVSASVPTLFPEGGQLGLRTRRPLPLDALRGPSAQRRLIPSGRGQDAAAGKPLAGPHSVCSALPSRRQQQLPPAHERQGGLLAARALYGSAVISGPTRLLHSLKGSPASGKRACSPSKTVISRLLMRSLWKWLQWTTRKFCQ